MFILFATISMYCTMLMNFVDLLFHLALHD